MEKTNNVELVRNFFEQLWNNNDLNSINECCSSDVELCVGDERIRGSEGFRTAASLILKAFPGIRFSIDELFESPNRVVIRWTGKGKHQGEFMGIPASGKDVNYWGINIYELMDGKVTRQWGSADIDVLLAQLRGKKSEFSLSSSKIAA